MPTYEYECHSCRQRFEVKQSFSDEPVKVCPSCGGEVRRVLHAPGIVFKGSGWYVTDSRKSPDSSSEGAAPAAASTDGAAASSGSGEAKSSDAKAEPKKSAGGDASSGSSDSGSGGTSKAKAG
jgi:putative FmdB family regulatory protein